ncbi:M28 family peptidase [Yunchengibacter salinarum]|uniref:M28 family peptidase n=1 Tax=Yunchengibacter salinarum TaxID=3133399 RepID=UPI0035B66893
MALGIHDVLNRLGQYPHRRAGSENELYAREELAVPLEGIPGLFITEEPFNTPGTPLVALALTALGLIACVWAAGFLAGIISAAALALVVLMTLVADGRGGPLSWFLARLETANLVASKGEGRRLVLILAHLDSPLNDSLFRPGQAGYRRQILVGLLVLFVLSAIVPIMADVGVVPPLWLKWLVSAALLTVVMVAAFDAVRLGPSPGGNDNLSGVAAATVAASRLWERLPRGCEVRLVVTSAAGPLRLGALDYWRRHRQELRQRQTLVLALDCVGAGDLGVVTRFGGLTPVQPDNGLTRLAGRLMTEDGRFTHLKAHRTGLDVPDSLPFMRDGLPGLVIGARDAAGQVPRRARPDDTVAACDRGLIHEAALFAEAFVRALPPVRSAASSAVKDR